jgi:hypothetical protein
MAEGGGRHSHGGAGSPRTGRRSGGLTRIFVESVQARVPVIQSTSPGHPGLSPGEGALSVMPNDVPRLPRERKSRKTARIAWGTA